MELDLKYYTLFLTITLLFVIFILRACYFIFVAKIDPIKTIIPENTFIKNLLKRMDERKDREERNKFS